MSETTVTMSMKDYESMKEEIAYLKTMSIRNFVELNFTDIIKNEYTLKVNKKAIKEAYEGGTQMTFGKALDALKHGHKVARKGWNGKGMFIYLVGKSKVKIEQLRNEAAVALDSTNEFNRGRVVTISSHIDMKAADGSIVIGWLASQTDMLAEDWEVIQ